MKVLEITPLENKTLTVLLVEREYNEPFGVIESPNAQTLRSLFKPSIAFCDFLEKMMKKLNPDFATEELGIRSTEEFYGHNVLAELFQRHKIPFYPTDIDENARGYLWVGLAEKKQLRNQVLDRLSKFNRKRDEKEDLSMEEEFLVAYGQSLHYELEEEERKINFPVREAWIVMDIIDNARKISDKEEVTCFHICSPEHVKGIKELLESQDVNVETLKITKKVVHTGTETSHPEELADLLQSMHIQVKPIIKKASRETPHLLFFLDTDKRASPFDICMAYDAGFNAVIPYANVTPEDAKNIVQDAIFSRTKEGINRTCFFIGGKNEEKAQEVFETVRNTMFPPFEAPIILDPGGAHTTATAMIAKVENAIHSHKLGHLKDKNCSIFGTGPIGRVVAVLLARLGCDTMIVSLNPNRSNGEEYVEGVSRRLLQRYGVNVHGVFAPTTSKKIEVLKKADIIFCTAARGVRIISKDMLKKLKLMKVIADINAIPPLGVDGIKLKDNMREISPGIFGIGALTIGKLKHELEMAIMRQARKNGKGTYDYNFALQLARQLLQKKITFNDLTLTLKPSIHKYIAL